VSEKQLRRIKTRNKKTTEISPAPHMPLEIQLQSKSLEKGNGFLNFCQSEDDDDEILNPSMVDKEDFLRPQLINC